MRLRKDCSALRKPRRRRDQVPIFAQRLSILRPMSWRLIAIAIGLLALALPASAEQRQKAPATARGMVTILTDGIAEPNGSATRAINELAKEIGNIRILPIAGHGAVSNVRDLLRLKGVDFAVLNSDILPFLEQTRQYPNARFRHHLVADGQWPSETGLVVCTSQYSNAGKFAWHF